MYAQILYGLSKKKLNQVIYHVTYKCNSRCQTCFNWKNLKESHKNELSIDEINKISKSMDNFLWFLVSGGEPFLREDLDEICETFYFNNKVKHFSIPTNGILTKEIERKTKNILKICENSTINLILSLDGIGKKHDEIRGVEGNFEKLLTTFQAVRTLKEDYNNFSIKIHTVITNRNYRYLDEITDYVKKELKPDIHTFDFIRGDPREKSLELPPINELGDLISKIKRVYSDYGGYKNLSVHSKVGKRFSKALLSHYNDLFLKTVIEEKRVIPCYAGNVNAMIDPYGNVGFCEGLNTFGNLRDFDYNFKKLWISEKANILRNDIKNKICYCYHPCYQYTNILFNPSELIKSLKYLY